MTLFGRPLADHQPDRILAAKRRVGQEDRRVGVDALEEPAIELVEAGLVAAVVEPEADEPEIDRGQELEAAVGLDPVLDEPGQPDMLSDHGLQPLDAIAPDDEPELEGPKAPAELDAPI